MTMFVKKLIYMILVVGFLIAGVFYLIFFTRFGAVFVFNRAASHYAQDEWSWDMVLGDLARGITLENVELIDIKELPLPNRLRIQKLYIKMNGLSINSVTGYVHNARLVLPGSDPIVFETDIQEGRLVGNAHTRMLVSDDLSWLPVSLPLRLRAEIHKVDVDFEGGQEGMAFKGSFDIGEIRRDGVGFQKSHCTFGLNWKGVNGQHSLYGQAVFRQGMLSAKRTAMIFLDEGTLVFEGDPMNPRFDIRANSRVERVDMDIMLKGHFERPDLYIKSQSGLSQQQLLMMIATNQSWAQTERGLKEQSMSPGVAKDFLDYFLSGYSDNKAMSWFVDWVRRVSVDYDRQTGAMGLRAGLTDRLEAGYAVENTATSERRDAYRISGEYQITDRFSIYGEKEIRDQQTTSDGLSNPHVSDDRLLFKIRNKF